MVVEINEDKRQQVPEGSKLFVHVITQETANHDLQAVVQVYGTVTDAYNPGKGLAFVIFTKPAEAYAAMEALEGQECSENTVNMEIALDNEKVKDKISKYDHMAAADNVTADET